MDSVADDLRSRAVELWNSGDYSAREIAQSLEIRRGTLTALLSQARTAGMEVRKGGSPPWTPEDDALLVELAARGDPLDRLAFRLRRTPSAVETRLAKLRAKGEKAARLAGPGGWTARNDEQLLAEFRRGYSLEQIATRMQRQPEKVRNRLIALQSAGEDLVIPSKRWTPSEEDRLLRLTAAGHNSTTIARTLGRTEHSVRTRLRRLAKSEKE